MQHTNGATNGHDAKALAPSRSRTKPAKAKPAKPEPAAAAPDRTGAVAAAVASIADLVREMQPARTPDQDVVAADYWAASLVAQLAEAWRNRAKRAATAVGVLPDYATSPFAIGSSETVYVGELVTIGMRVVEQADRVDVPGMVAMLEAGGVKAALIKRALKANTRSFPGAHIFTATTTK